ncbi:MAG: HD domain-containing protein [Armatimonadetes bacterium]|nr:HD domain-containing protein [Armatimonadota bacterium]
MNRAHEKKRILIVDPDEGDRAELSRKAAGWGYLPETAQDGYECLAQVYQDIDLVLLEVTLPGMDAFELLRQMRSEEDLETLPVVLLTRDPSRENRMRAVAAGANDMLMKPVDGLELETRLAFHLSTKKRQDALRDALSQQEALLRKRTAMLQRTLHEVAAARRQAYAAELDTLHRLAQAAELKDHGAAEHIHRVGRCCALIAQAVHRPPREVELIRAASPLHDVGKIGVPDHILLKAGSLTDEEWEIMKQHTILGGRILEGSGSELLQTGAQIALTHHERWDGSGYPYGLAGSDIPLAGRICAIADAFDSLTMDRPYRERMPMEEAFRQVEEGRARNFDPELTDRFLERREEARAIREGS